MASLQALGVLAAGFVQPIAIGVLLGQGWHTYSEVLSRGSYGGLAICAVGLCLGLGAALALTTKVTGSKAQIRLTLFWMSCVMNGGLSSIAQLRLRMERFSVNEDALFVNSFLSSGLLGCSLPHAVTRVVQHPEAEVLMPCVLAVLVTEAFCNNQSFPSLQVVVALMLLGMGVQGFARELGGLSDYAGLISSTGTRASSKGAASISGSGRGVKATPPAPRVPGPPLEAFFPATVLDAQRYSPHFLVSRRKRCLLPASEGEPLLVSLVSRQAAPDPSAQKASRKAERSGKVGGKDRRDSKGSDDRASPAAAAFEESLSDEFPASRPKQAEVGEDIRWNVILEEMNRVDGGSVSAGTAAAEAALQMASESWPSVVVDSDDAADQRAEAEAAKAAARAERLLTEALAQAAAVAEEEEATVGEGPDEVDGQEQPTSPVSALQEDNRPATTCHPTAVPQISFEDMVAPEDSSYIHGGPTGWLEGQGYPTDFQYEGHGEQFGFRATAAEFVPNEAARLSLRPDACAFEPSHQHSISAAAAAAIEMPTEHTLAPAQGMAQWGDGYLADNVWHGDGTDNCNWGGGSWGDQGYVEGQWGGYAATSFDDGGPFAGDGIGYDQAAMGAHQGDGSMQTRHMQAYDLQSGYWGSTRGSASTPSQSSRFRHQRNRTFEEVGIEEGSTTFQEPPVSLEPIESLIDNDFPDPGLGRASAIRRGFNESKRASKGGSSGSFGSEGKGLPVPSPTLWVGGATAWIDEEALADLFKSFGKVACVKVLRSGSREGTRVSALVDFDSTAAAGAALEGCPGGCLTTKDGAELSVMFASGGTSAATAVECAQGSKGFGKGQWDRESGGNAGPRSHDQLPSDTSQGPMYWSYIDPHGKIQFGFASEEMRVWFELGYFKGNLQVALAEGPKTHVPDKSEFYSLKQWFPESAKSFTFIPVPL